MTLKGIFYKNDKKTGEKRLGKKRVILSGVVIFFLFIFVLAAFSPPLPANNNTPITNTTTSENQTSHKITDDMTRIQADVWDGTPEGTPLFEAGYPASLEMGNTTYFIDENVYQPLIQYFGNNGTDKPFYAKVETRKVLMNPDAKVIVEVFDLEGKPLK